MNDQELEVYIRKEYETNEQSIAAIAQELGTYSNFVLRKAKKFGIKIRDKSSAQELALKSGRQAHPTKGKIRDEVTKNKIGSAVSTSWDKISPAEKERRSEMGKQQWDRRSELEKQHIHKQAGDAIRKASQTGSKLEKYLSQGLTKAGYVVQCHVEKKIVNEKLHFDIFLPKHNIVCEIDGLSHFEDIWGAEKLKQTQQADSRKTGLILGRGLVLIRIKQTKYVSKIYMRKVLNKLLPIIKSVVEKFPPLEDRCITIET